MQQTQRKSKIWPRSSAPTDSRVIDRDCSTHGPYSSTEVKIDGEWIGSDCPQCEEDARRLEAEALRTERLASSVLSSLRVAGIPRRFINKSFDNYNASDSKKQVVTLDICRRYADGFKNVIEGGVCLSLCGSPGTGKTHLACAIGNRLVMEGKSVLFVGTARAVGMVKNTYRRDSFETENDVIEKLTELDLLILDEVGVQFGSETEKQILFRIINRRYEEMKPTIVIANLTEKELEGYLDERGVDRLRENGGPLVVFDWKSYRRK